MTMENQPFEDVLPLKNGDFSILMLVFRGGNPFFNLPFSTVTATSRRTSSPKKYISFLKMIVSFGGLGICSGGELLIWVICLKKTHVKRYDVSMAIFKIHANLPPFP